PGPRRALRMGMATSPQTNGVDAALLERVRGLLPSIAEATPRIEADRRIPEPLLTRLMEAGLYHAYVPRSLGGLQVHPLTMMHALELIAGVEASTAWNIGQNVVTGTQAAYLPEAIARKIFATPRGILAWGPATGECKAVRVPGGFRATGKWSFASGMRHATWLGGHCTVIGTDGAPEREKDGAVAYRTMLIPATSATLIDDWHVMGLRGTASDTFTVQDLFVPEDHAIIRDNAAERRDPSLLYCFTTLNLFACGFGSVALGVARAMLDAFIQLATEKVPRSQKSTLRESASTQLQVGQAEAKWRSARMFLRGSLADIWATVEQTRQVTMEQRVTIRMAATHAIHQAREVGDFAYEAAGASAIFDSNSFEKRFRDLHTIAQQVQGRRANFESVGKFLMGLEPDTAFL
ncbi:MAG TPA: acyl-CoA dehydrogenase family protein, partial [bacterium]